VISAQEERRQPGTRAGWTGWKRIFLLETKAYSTHIRTHTHTHTHTHNDRTPRSQILKMIRASRSSNRATRLFWSRTVLINAASINLNEPSNPVGALIEDNEFFWGFGLLCRHTASHSTSIVQIKNRNTGVEGRYCTTFFDPSKGFKFFFLDPSAENRSKSENGPLN